MKIKCDCESPVEISFSINENGQYTGGCPRCCRQFGFKNKKPDVIHNPFKGDESRRSYRRPPKAP